jgi:glycosyltransferase involved in cell wall biosynthesis
MPTTNLGSVEISIVIPTFNNFESLLGLISGLEEEFRNHKIEIVVVDDASGNQEEFQGAWSARFGNSRARKLYVLSKNIGQLKATWFGFSQTSGEIVVTMDDDGQHDPSEVRKLIRALVSNSSYDFAMAGFASKEAPVHRRILSELNRRITVRSLGVPPNTKFSSFMAIRRDFLNHCLSVEDPDSPRPRWMFESSLLFSNPTLQHLPRDVGISSYSARKLFRAASQTLIGLATSALSSLMLLGVAISLVALSWSAYTLVTYWTKGIDVDGYLSTNLISSLSLFLSSLMFSLISYLAKSNLPLTKQRLPMVKAHEEPRGSA